MPVLVFLEDVLTVCHAGERHAVHVTPESFHALKAAAHAPIALYLLLAPLTDETVDDVLLGRLQSLVTRTNDALAQLETHVAESGMVEDARRVLELTATRARDVLTTRRNPAAEVERFARTQGPALLTLTDHASRVQLEALHRATEEVLAAMNADARERFHVVVAGAHQARERSLAMQYFQLRLREPPGSEERVTYAENASSVDEALALVGVRRLDRAIARAFFGDEKRLQRDILGDSAKAQLAAFADTTWVPC